MVKSSWAGGTPRPLFCQKNKNAHQLLGCSHFALFAISPGTFCVQFFFTMSAMQCQRRLQISRVKNIGNVFELSVVAFRLAHIRVGFLCKCCNRYILRHGGWLYFSSILSRRFCVLSIRQLWDWCLPPPNTFRPKVANCEGVKPKPIRLDVVEKDP